MKISFRQTETGNVLVIREPGKREYGNYMLHILRKNPLPGILSVEKEMMDGEEQLLYEITSLQSLEQMIEKGQFQENQFLKLLLGIQFSTELFKEYLLDPSCLLLKTSCIFTDQECSRFFFCCQPFQNSSIEENLRELMDELLELISCEDSHFAESIYEFHKAVQEEAFHIRRLQEYLIPKMQDGIHVHRMFEEHRFERQPEEQKPVPEQSGTKETGFLQKLNRYLKKSTFREILSDIGEGMLWERIFQESGESVYSGQWQEGTPDRKQDPFSGDLFQGMSAEEEKRFWNSVIRFEKTPERTVFLQEQKQYIHYLTGIHQQEGRMIELNRYPFLIGQIPYKTDCALYAGTVSRIHARLDEDAKTKECFIEDLNSTNGTYLNRKKLEAYTRVAIQKGDTVGFADQEFIFR